MFQKSKSPQSLFRPGLKYRSLLLSTLLALVTLVGTKGLIPSNFVTSSFSTPSFSVPNFTVPDFSAPNVSGPKFLLSRITEVFLQKAHANGPSDLPATQTQTPKSGTNISTPTNSQKDRCLIVVKGRPANPKPIEPVRPHSAAQAERPLAALPEQIGYESEYLFDESGPILSDYKPTSISEKKWLMEMTMQDRINFIKNLFQETPEYAQETDLTLIRRSDTPSFMPDKLVLDATGNLELILMPINSQKEWAEAVRYIVSRYQAGSQQAMISVPREEFFKGPDSHEANLGWLNFQNEYDTLSKLAKAYEKYQKNPTFMVARSFAHPFLGPMTLAKQNHLTRYLKENAKGNLYDPESKRFMKTDASFKYIGGIAYRPDIASPERAAFEIRHAHKDFETLRAYVERDLLSLHSNRTPYRGFSKARAFNSRNAFRSLPLDVQKMLKELFPSKVNNRFTYSQEEILANEVYRNFSYPLRLWGPFTKALNRPDLNPTISAAKESYRKALKDIARKFHTKKITKEQAQIEVQGALAQFADSCKLVPALEEFKKNLKNPDQQEFDAPGENETSLKKSA